MFNWIAIFGIFEYIRSSTGDVNLVRTMAINSLIAGRIFYLLSLRQLVPNLIAKMNGTIQKNVDIPTIGFGIVGAVILQLIFSCVPIINEMFSTAPLSFDQ